MKFADGMITRLVRVGDELQFEVAWDKPEDGDTATTVLESEIRPRPITQARGSVFCLSFPIPRHPPNPNPSSRGLLGDCAVVAEQWNFSLQAGHG